MSETLLTIVFIFALLLGIAWIILPFLVMGINNRLDKLIRLMSQRPGVSPSPPADPSGAPETGDQVKAQEASENNPASNDSGFLLVIGIIIGAVALAYLLSTV